MNITFTRIVGGGQPMAKYRRRKNDLYPSPPWVIDELFKFHMPRDGIYEPACGPKRLLVNRLLELMPLVHGTDIVPPWRINFLDVGVMPMMYKTILTNPPYDICVIDKFIANALKLAASVDGKVMLLLRVEFDCAKTRKPIFKDHPHYVGKVILTRRLVIPGLPTHDRKTGKKKAGPMKHHAWYVWDFAKKTKIKRVDYA